MANFRGGRDAFLFDWYRDPFELTARQAEDGYTKRLEFGKCLRYLTANGLKPTPQGQRPQSSSIGAGGPVAISVRIMRRFRQPIKSLLFR